MIDIQTLLGQGNPPLVGIDISTSSVRLVELTQSKGDIRLERYASEPLPRGAVVDGNIENMDQVVEAVRRVWKKSGTRAKHAALGMPPASVITKKIILPAGMSEDQLEVQVESEASQYIPFALDEVSLDFDVIGPAANSPEDIEVMLAASRREKVEDRVAIAEASGLKATVMDIESYAARAALDRVTAQLPEAGAGQVVALFQVGAQVTHISVMLDGVTVYEREQPFGGNALTQDIVRSYGMAFDEAESRKKSGDLPDNYAADLLAPFLESAALEVTRAIQFFYTSTPYTKVDQLFLAGGCAAARPAGTGGQPHQDLQRRHLAVQGHAAGALGARIATAQRRAGLPGRLRPGLAEVRLMIRINLLPHREEKRKQKKAAFFALLALGAIVGVGVVLLVGGYNARAISIQNERNQVIKTAITGLDTKIAEIATLKQEIEALKARQQAVEDLQGDRNQPVYLMDELVKQTPPGVYLKVSSRRARRCRCSAMRSRRSGCPNSCATWPVCRRGWSGRT